MGASLHAPYWCVSCVLVRGSSQLSSCSLSQPLLDPRCGMSVRTEDADSLSSGSPVRHRPWSVSQVLERHCTWRLLHILP